MIISKDNEPILALGAANTHDLTGDVTISAGQMRIISGTSDAYSFDVIVANGANASVNHDTFASGNSITVQSGGSLNFEVIFSISDFATFLPSLNKINIFFNIRSSIHCG